jgi:hypothetical protein
MTTRDRILILAALSVALLGGFWFLALSPKRTDAKALDARLATAQQRLQTAQTAAASAATAKRRYSRDYAAVARLGAAVPSDDDTATLLYQLQSAAHGSKVDLRTFALGAAAASSSNSTPAGSAAATPPASGTSGTATASAGAVPTQAAAATLPPGAAVGTAGFPTMPFEFAFEGSFADMQRLLTSVQNFVRVNGSDVSVNGRLLTIDGIALLPQKFPRVKATIEATAFVLPTTQASTAAATTGSAAGQSASSSTTSTTTSATGVAP